MVGNIVLAASTSKPSGFNATSLIWILIVIVGFYLLMTRSQRRRRQQAQQRQNSVQAGARVRTTAGMYATVVDVDGDDVVLEVAPGVQVRYMRRAIMDVVGPAEEPEEPMTDSAEEAEDEPAEETSEQAGEWTAADENWDKVESDDVAESGTSKSGTGKKD